MENDSLMHDSPFSDMECERRVLGLLLFDSTFLAEITSILTPEDWSLDIHRYIFEIIVHLTFEQIPVNIERVAEELQQQALLDTIGGRSYLSDLPHKPEGVQSFIDDARRLHHLALRRQLTSIGRRMIALAHHEADTLQALTEAEALFTALSPTRGLVSLHDLIQGYRPLAQETQHRAETILGIPTGFVDLDRLLGGLQPAKMMVVSSPPSVGKTTFALSVLLNVVTRFQRSVGVFSLKRTAQQLINRLISMHAGMGQYRLLISRLDEQLWQQLSFTLDTLAKTNVWIDDTPDLSLDQLEQRARWMVRVAKCDLLIIDAVNLMHVRVNGKRYENRVQEVAELSRGLKILARTLQIPLMVLMPMSRQISQRETVVKRAENDREAPTPRLSDLRDGSFENDADIVVFISRDDSINPSTSRQHLVDLIVAQHRDGPKGEITVFCSPDNYYLHDLNVTPPSDETDEHSGN